MYGILVIIAGAFLTLKLLSCGILYTNNPTPENIDKAEEIIGSAATPLWLSMVAFLDSLSGIGAIAAVALIFFLLLQGRAGSLIRPKSQLPGHRPHTSPS